MAKHKTRIKVLFWFYALILTWLLLRKAGTRDLEVLNWDFSYLYNDKVVHTTVFLALTLLGIFAFSKIKPVILVGIFTAYGISIEILQGCMGLGRTFEYADILSDFIGCLLGSAIAKILLKKQNKKHLI